MKKTFKIVYSALFFAVCAAPLALMPFVQSNAEIEKKALAEMPSLVSDGKLNNDFSDQFESWYNDRLPLRSQLLSAANFVKSGLLTSPSSNVITGSDGWIFFETDKLDYMNTNALPESRIRATAVTLSLIEENVTSRGGSFTFVPMPNKASVYSEHFPSCYTKERLNNLNRICRELDGLGVNYVDMLGLMTENKSMGLYHKRDSHWNYLGALLGYNAIMDSLAHPHKTYDNASYSYEKTWRGDLDKLLYPSGGFMDWQYNFDIDFDEFMFTFPAGVEDTQAQLEIFMSDKEENDTRISTKQLEGDASGRLYMVRDSFGRALLPFMIDNYASAMFVRTDCPELTTVADGTDMVYEIVERNLANVTATAPFMFAPERNAVTSGEAAPQLEEVTVSDEGYGVRIYGTLPEDFDGSRVYVRLTNGPEEKVFEAFPIFERKLIGRDSDENGFSMILSPSEELSGEYTVSVIAGGMEYPTGKTLTK